MLETKTEVRIIEIVSEYKEAKNSGSAQSHHDNTE